MRKSRRHSEDSAVMAEGASEVEILKPRCDKREYRRFVLPNSLEVLIISDPETDKAAASMNVSVGSFSNPDGLEGLAHFLEHMLFYASKKYPIEDSYSKFITEHGGSTNAYTSSEHTNYHFDVNVDSFEEALDRTIGTPPLLPPQVLLIGVCHQLPTSLHNTNLFLHHTKNLERDETLNEYDHLGTSPSLILLDYPKC